MRQGTKSGGKFIRTCSASTRRLSCASMAEDINTLLNCDRSDWNKKGNRKKRKVREETDHRACALMCQCHLTT